jgi:hypothetical protein
MRGYILATVIWSALMQVSSACPACNARIGDSLTAPAHAHHHHRHHGHAGYAPVAGCSQCGDGVGLPGYGPCYNNAFCSPSDPQLFYAELYRRYYLELERLKLRTHNPRPAEPEPLY